MNDNYTPGEWMTKDGFVSVDDKLLICEVYDRANFLPRNGTTVPDEWQGAANARLITAAPDMLKALQAIYAAPFEDGTWNHKAAMDAVYKAIKKATHEPQT